MAAEGGKVPRVRVNISAQPVTRSNVLISSVLGLQEFVLLCFYDTWTVKGHLCGFPDG